MAQAYSKIKNISSFQEELSFLRIKDREPGQVGLPGVYLSFCEIGIQLSAAQ